MNIEYKNYILEQDSNGRFDLKQKVERNKLDENKNQTGEKYSSVKDLAYSMTFENIIKRILLLELYKNRKTVDLKKFLTEYKKEKEELLQTIKLD